MPHLGLAGVWVTALFLYLEPDNMKKSWKTALVLMFFITGSTFSQDNKTGFDRRAFYKAMEWEQVGLVNDQLNQLQTISLTGKDAFEGALIMKKAGFSGSAEKKLGLFKSGRKKLEAAIKEDSSNVEFRFLRLMVQEHAPGILGYKGALQMDGDYIRKSYKTLPLEVQQAILDYNKKSKILKLPES
jgi:hypothetical protein